MVLVVACVVFAYLLVTNKPHDLASVLLAAAASVIGGVAGLFAGFLFSLIWVSIASSEKSGVLGRHRYVLNSAGLHESTPVNEGLQMWAGIQSIGQSRGYIFFRVNSCLFHLIPKRSFPSDDAAKEFWTRAQELWNQGTPDDAKESRAVAPKDG